jgi:mRNA-degrading endonuclease RelE of RelBE toxin-antitoxin system
VNHDDERSRWQVVVSASAVRAIEQLREKVAAAVVEFITVTLPTNPHRLGKPLRYELEGWRSARRGDYRVTFRIEESESRLVIGRIEHRSTVYRRR